MKETPILMSGPMVRAINDGRKKQTRRVVKPQPVWVGDPGVPFRTPDADPNGIIQCPYGQPGDLLLVKESAWMWCERRPSGKTNTGRDKWHYVPMREAPIHYAADHPEKPTISVVSPDTGNTWGWRMKIGRFLPKWAVRTRLKITAARVERLQDISEADANAEGCSAVCDTSLPTLAMLMPCDRPATRNYCKLWESINGAGSWDSNPWVWVIEFRRVDK